ncbi:flavodoxin [Acidiferrimicrobium sp. IK]|uniref:flavodoxin family protein n=1 Tax=Acidiferrimicrobium sp. IK TaxID=2871700 RepID=UPI0021CB6C90|nr:flavodoxin [Acidiferrimicrobium sp. IK]MCU4183436.1 flavodoxin [Acidiferrimicrobium sp. IK]
MPRLLFVHHTVSPATHDCYLAALEGASDPAIEGVEVVSRAALSATASDALDADGYLLGAPVTLGYLAGGLKHFFDTVYYQCLEQTRGRPFGVYLHGNQGLEGGVRAIRTITAGLGWRLAQPVVELLGAPDPADLAACRELGAAVAAGLLL